MPTRTMNGVVFAAALLVLVASAPLLLDEGDDGHEDANLTLGPATGWLLPLALPGEFVRTRPILPRPSLPAGLGFCPRSPPKSRLVT